jgi:hypothetical protein
MGIATHDTFMIFIVLDERGLTAYPAFRHVDLDSIPRIRAARLGAFDIGVVCRRSRRRRHLWRRHLWRRHPWRRLYA